MRYSLHVFLHGDMSFGRVKLCQGRDDSVQRVSVWHPRVVGLLQRLERFDRNICNCDFGHSSL